MAVSVLQVRPMTVEQNALIPVTSLPPVQPGDSAERARLLCVVGEHH